MANSKLFLENDFPKQGMWRMILDHLLNYDDPVFQDKLHKSTQSFEQLKKYINDEARGYIRKNNTPGDGHIDDEIVYGWAVHFIDENIQKSIYKASEPLREVQTAQTAVTKPKESASENKKEERTNPQLSMFDIGLLSPEEVSVK